MDVDALARARLSLKVRLRGGYTLPVAGCLYWSALAVAGTQLEPRSWILVAFLASGSIFPIAGLIGRAVSVDLLQPHDPLAPVALQATIGMNLLWPVHVALMSRAPELVPLSLAVGMAVHWPVIGWMFGSRIYTAHAAVRVAGAWALWQWVPEARFTVLPAFVAACYAVTALALYLTSAPLRRNPVVQS